VAKKVFRAKLRRISDGTVALIYVGSRWRIFSVPIAENKDWVTWPPTNTNARRAADSVAEALGIKLIWEEK
jgi:hypothetical protein